MSSVQLAVPSSVAEVTVPRAAGTVVPVGARGRTGARPGAGSCARPGAGSRAARGRKARAAEAGSPLPGDRAVDPEDGKQLRSGDFDLGDRLPINGVVLAYRLVGDRHLRLELIEQGIVKIGPPVALGSGIRRGGPGPSLRGLLLELLGDGRARPVVIGADHAGSEPGGQGEEIGDSCTRHGEILSLKLPCAGARVIFRCIHSRNRSKPR